MLIDDELHKIVPCAIFSGGGKLLQEQSQATTERLVV